MTCLCHRGPGTPCPVHGLSGGTPASWSTPTEPAVIPGSRAYPVCRCAVREANEPCPVHGYSDQGITPQTTGTRPEPTGFRAVIVAAHWRACVFAAARYMDEVHKTPQSPNMLECWQARSARAQRQAELVGRMR